MSRFWIIQIQGENNLKTPNNSNTKDVKIAVPLKYLSNIFWKTLEMLLINCEINVILTCCKDWVICSPTGATKYSITNAKLYVPILTFSIQNNANCLNNKNLVLQEQLTGININQKHKK